MRLSFFRKKQELEEEEDPIPRKTSDTVSTSSSSDRASSDIEIPELDPKFNAIMMRVNQAVAKIQRIREEMDEE